MVVRRAVVGDEAVLRDLRIAALTDVPEAFGSTLEREKARTVEDWRRWFAPGATYFALDEAAQPVGLVAGVLDEDSAVAHLAAMWVRPDRRGQGVADALVGALVQWAEEEERHLRLHVVNDNARAVGLYERHGFRPTGDVEVRADGVREAEMARTAP